MGAVTLAIIGVVGVALGWIAIELACKPCLEKGREAIDRNLNPDYDPDDDDNNNNNIRAPLNPDSSAVSDSSSSQPPKSV